MPITVEDDVIVRVKNVLIDQQRPMKERFRALFTLKNLGSEKAIAGISECFSDPSALLKHECAYCLGQLKDTSAIPILSSVLKDTCQDEMVRHEAGEALGAIGSTEVIDLLKEYSKDSSVAVAETCQLAVERIQWLHSEKSKQEILSENPYCSVDPAPPCEESSVNELKATLLDETLPLFKRYRAMFSLRNRGDDESALSLAEGLKCKSALFRHEIAYVLGQMANKSPVEQLKVNLQDENEVPMVRHECAEALGAIATDECMQLLQNYLKDREIVVKESCEVALDMCDYNKSDEFQYADGLNKQQFNT
ncbi:deoxyhypusine hydroxylase-like [Tubulanus polymorphus]|uniref:deoxyhypusine hydroxylase-like n=1 Tax=Tubulanus polymorphus TaxID=672921 RepID=UPI003DA5FE25